MENRADKSQAEKESFRFEEVVRLKLQDELMERCRVNPRYSLRAFARSLKTDPSTLSQILKGKRKISLKKARSIISRLRLEDQDIEELFREFYTDPGEEFSGAEISIENFIHISDWYYLAIRQLLKIPDFHGDYRKISKVLGITVNQTQIALERLARLGLLKKDSNGLYSSSDENISTLSNVFNHDSLRKVQIQILERAIEQIKEEAGLERRDQTTMTMAIDPARIPEAKEKIKRFRRNLCQFLEAGEAKEVYQLTISLFPETNLQKVRETKDV